MSDLEKTAFYGDLVGVKIGVECCYFGIELLRDTQPDDPTNSQQMAIIIGST